MISGFLVNYKYNFRTFSRYFWQHISKPGPQRSFCKGMEVFWMIWWFLLTIELISLILTCRGEHLSGRPAGERGSCQVQLSRRAKVSACKWRFLWFDLATKKRGVIPSTTFFALPQIHNFFLQNCNLTNLWGTLVLHWPWPEGHQIKSV